MARECDAFISYTRQQGEPVAARVFELLKTERFTIWQDRIHMRGGEDFWRQIEAAIEQSRYLIMVLTPDAFEGDRQVLRDEWLTARRRGCSILPVHEKGEVDFSGPKVPPWLRKIDCYDLANNNHRQKLLNDLRTTPHVMPIPHNVEFPTHYVRRESEMREVIGLLTAAPSGGRVATTTALLGAGGFGKTTLAKAVCFADEILARYTDGVLWLTVGERERGASELLSALLSQLGQAPKSSDQDALFGEWKERLRTRQCLIVLDDVWRETDVQSLVVRETASGYLITTRIPRVASSVDASNCSVEAMTLEQSVALLASALGGAGSRGEDFENRLTSLADRAGNWPVLLGLIAGQLRHALRRPGASAAAVVDQVLEDLQDLGLTAFDRENANQREAAVASTVEASLRYLKAINSQAPDRYYELAVFPDDISISLEALQDLWKLSRAETRRLAERFDDSGLSILHLERGLNVHDVFLHYVRAKWSPADLAALHRRLLSAWPDFHRLPHDYAWRWFGWHCIGAGDAGTLGRALLDFDWLSARLEVTDLASLLTDCDRAMTAAETARRSLSLVKEALEKSAHVLLTAPRQLGNQLYGRLRPGLTAEIDALLEKLKPALTAQALAPLIQNLQPVNSPLRRTLRGHNGSVNGALALADGRLLSWSNDSTLRLWSTDGAPIAELSAYWGRVKGALIIPEGRLLSWSDDMLVLWSSDGVPLAELSGHEDSIRGALALADGRLLSWSDDNTLRLWSASGEPVFEMLGHGHSVLGAVPVAGGRLLSWSHDNTLRLWSADGAPLATLRGHHGSVKGALPVPNGRLLSWSRDGALRLWSSDGAPLAEMREHESVDGALRLSDGRLLSWGLEDGICIWSSEGALVAKVDVHVSFDHVLSLAEGRWLSWSKHGRTLQVWSREGAPVAELSGHENRINGAQLLADGRLLSWSHDSTLRLWALDIVSAGRLHGHKTEVKGAVPIADNRVLSWSEDGGLQSWSADGVALANLTGHESEVHGVLSLPNGRLLSWSPDSLRLWSKDGAPFAELIADDYRVSGAIALADGQLLSWFTDGNPQLWSADGARVADLKGHKDSVDGALLLARGELLSWSSHTLRLWSKNGAPVAELRGHKGSVKGALELANGRLLSWSDNGTLRLWSGDGNPIAQMRGHKAAVDGVLQLAHGKLLSWSNDALRLWSADGASVARLRGHKNGVYGALAFSDGGLLTWSATELRLWSSNGAPVCELRGHKDFLWGVLLLADGRPLSWSSDGTVRLWSREGASVAELKHEDQVAGVLPLADDRLLSWSRDSTLRLWDLVTLTEVDSLYFDAAPTVIVQLAPDRLFVGDAVGSVHWVHISPASQHSARIATREM